MAVRCSDKIPFNRPYMTGLEHDYIAQAYANGKLAGDGPFTDRCHALIQQSTGGARTLLTHSCTAALEMCALLLGVEPGDEIIMPSFTFVSTANAFVLRGGIPVFVDIRPDTLNIDERQIENAISSRTKAIVVVHYAGISCNMAAIIKLARRHGIRVIEDAAQGVGASLEGKALGTFGDLGCYSFHETKNIICGEGGALLVNDQGLIDSAEIIREKGTDRNRFFRGQVDKYTWQTLGSSFLPGELTAAFLLAQLENIQCITDARIAAWQLYDELLAPLAAEGMLGLPTVPQGCEHNGHLYYVVLPQGVDRNLVLSKLNENGIGAVFHYVPLHKSPAGKKYGKTLHELPVTDSMSARLLRLPLWVGLSPDQQNKVVFELEAAIKVQL